MNINSDSICLQSISIARGNGQGMINLQLFSSLYKVRNGKGKGTLKQLNKLHSSNIASQHINKSLSKSNFNASFLQAFPRDRSPRQQFYFLSTLTIKAKPPMTKLLISFSCFMQLFSYEFLLSQLLGQYNISLNYYCHFRTSFDSTFTYFDLNYLHKKKSLSYQASSRNLS